ncbi:hypothetical protein [Methylotenera versatilis]|uniref:hypothetical protein n=1 Tax=Methylotenera versatilis TaxID=1055487 RepID=UPI0006912016|nr:hypothetical protein [Methylotenera versatilis]
MGASYEKQKKANADKLDVGRFTALPHNVIHSVEYRGLCHAARSLLFDIAAQYNGKNNGKLVCCMKYLKPLGWTSNDTISRSLKALIKSGLLKQTRQGMMPPCSQAAWFAIGWFSLDVYDGLDIEPRKYQRCRLTPINKTSPIIGVAKAKIAPIIGIESKALTPISGAIETINSQLSTPINGDFIDLPSTCPIIQQHYSSEVIRYDH